MAKPVLPRYGRLTTIERVGTRAQSPLWRCRCDCGNEGEFIMRHLRKGVTQSCGCLQKERAGDAHRTHGETNSDEYRAWSAMQNRCHYSTRAKNVADYQARGIVVCDRWRNSFENFLADMGRRPSPKHSLDRYPNNDGNYEPGNCRWATTTEQAANRRRAISMKTKLAAALLTLGHISHDHAKLMSADQIISLFNFDHYPIRKSDNGPDEPWNLRPLLILAHREKTAEKDAPEMAHNRDVRASVAIHKAKLALKDGNHVAAGDILATVSKKSRLKQKRKIASRGFSDGHRPLRSRSSFERRAP